MCARIIIVATFDLEVPPSLYTTHTTYWAVFDSPESHVSPAKPSRQSQEYSSSPSVHAPPFRHGKLAHSFISRQMKIKWKYSGWFLGGSDFDYMT